MNIIKSRIFNKFPNLVFGISTKEELEGSEYGLNLSIATNDKKENVLKSRSIFYQELGIKGNSVNYQKQVHGSCAKQINVPAFSGDCDATFTDKKGLFLTVSVADCFPVFLFEPRSNICAAIHCGWKGISENIIKNTIDSIKQYKEFETSNAFAYAGPGICENCFEVGDETAVKFPDEVIKKNNGKTYVNLKKMIIKQLKAEGVKSENIEVSEDCTFENKNLHSYRRDKDKSGRMFGIIGIRD